MPCRWRASANVSIELSAEGVSLSLIKDYNIPGENYKDAMHLFVVPPLGGGSFDQPLEGGTTNN
jgi:hypothetical protein